MKTITYHFFKNINKSTENMNYVFSLTRKRRLHGSSQQC